MIPPERSGSFVAHMERVLEVYRCPFDPLHPVVCMDESPKQLIGETRVPLPPAPGRPVRTDYEYRRLGVCTIFLASEPLAGRRMVSVTECKTKRDWALFLAAIAGAYPDAKRITLVMDNLNTHEPGSLYEAFPPDTAKALWDRFEFVYTPKHGSWLNMAEIELGVLMGQCLNRRIDDIGIVRREATAWEEHRNNRNARVNWHFRTEDARIKLKRLYPTLEG